MKLSAPHDCTLGRRGEACRPCTASRVKYLQYFSARVDPRRVLRRPVLHSPPSLLLRVLVEPFAVHARELHLDSDLEEVVKALCLTLLARETNANKSQWIVLIAMSGSDDSIRGSLWNQTSAKHV